MPNGRSIDPVPILGAAIIGGAVAWFLFRKKPVPEPKFGVGQRVALVGNSLETGTVTARIFGLSGIQSWFYSVLFDSTGEVSGPIEERFFIAI